MNKSKNTQRGFTRVETMIIGAVLVIVVMVGVPLYGNALTNARIAKAIDEIQAIAKTIKDFHRINDRYPPSLADIGWGKKVDPWGQPYEYLAIPPHLARKKESLTTSGRVTGERKTGTNNKRLRQDKDSFPLNTGFDLFSRGADGESNPCTDDATSRDDVIRAKNGNYYGLAGRY